MVAINEVAEAFITPLLEQDQLSLFRLDLPAGQTLADHETTPRIIILLTPLSGRRVADGSQVKAAAGQVMYLENWFSGALTNTGEDLAYLVLTLPGQTVTERSPDPVWHPSLSCLFQAAELVIWQFRKSAQLSVPSNMLHYAISSQSLTVRKTHESAVFSEGDLLLGGLI